MNLLDILLYTEHKSTRDEIQYALSYRDPRGMKYGTIKAIARDGNTASYEINKSSGAF